MYEHTTEERRRAWRFFLAQAGGVGRIDANGRPAMERARQALDLARAEELLQQAQDLSVAASSIEDDPEPYDAGDVATETEARELFASGEWTGPYGVVVNVWQQGDTTPSDHASLWGIACGPEGERDPYLRVVRAELADELTDELRQAIGDARDAREQLCA